MNTNEMKQPVVLITGLPRSGTTWLVQSLNEHPEILAFGETHFFTRRWVRPSRNGRYTSAGLKRVWRNLSSCPFWAAVPLKKDLGKRPGWFSRTSFDDLPEVLESGPACEVQKLLQVEMIPLRIMPMEKMPDFPRGFDVVTGLRTRFHSTKPEETGLDEETHWGTDEWTFFLKDLALRISENGRIFFSLNRMCPKGSPSWIPNAHRELFCSLGGRLDDNNLSFDNLEKLR